MKSFFFKGVISIFIVLRGPSHALAACPLLATLLGQAAPPRAIYLSFLLSFAINSNIAQAQQLSNRKYAAFKRIEVPCQNPQKVVMQSYATKKNTKHTKQTSSSARPSINISKITKTDDDKNDVANKTTNSEKKKKK